MSVSYFDQTVVFLYLILAAIGAVSALPFQAAEVVAEPAGRMDFAQ
jgi:hypothetical protein